jgi:CMP/dCMP kinase
MQYPIITITGDLGSGKSHVSRLISQEIGYRSVSTGTVQRQIAEEMGLTTLELNKLSETTPEIDARIDAAMIALKSETGILCDSRIAWHFLPHSLKICLTVALDVAAARVMADQQRKGEKYHSLTEARAALQARRQSELARFLNLYNIDCNDWANYDLVIDTTDAAPEHVAEFIVTEARQRTAHGPSNYWINPRAILPSANAPTTGPLEITEHGGFTYLTTGGATLQSALASGQPWVSAKLLSRGQPELGHAAATACSASLVEAWQQQQGFQFQRVPNF